MSDIAGYDWWFQHHFSYYRPRSVPSSDVHGIITDCVHSETGKMCGAIYSPGPQTSGLHNTDVQGTVVTSYVTKRPSVDQLKAQCRVDGIRSMINAKRNKTLGMFAYYYGPHYIEGDLHQVYEAYDPNQESPSGSGSLVEWALTELYNIASIRIDQYLVYYHRVGKIVMPLIYVLSASRVEGVTVQSIERPTVDIMFADIKLGTPVISRRANTTYPPWVQSPLIGGPALTEGCIAHTLMMYVGDAPNPTLGLRIYDNHTLVSQTETIIADMYTIPVVNAIGPVNDDMVKKYLVMLLVRLYSLRPEVIFDWINSNTPRGKFNYSVIPAMDIRSTVSLTVITSKGADLIEGSELMRQRDEIPPYLDYGDILVAFSRIPRVSLIKSIVDALPRCSRFDTEHDPIFVVVPRSGRRFLLSIMQLWNMTFDKESDSFEYDDMIHPLLYTLDNILRGIENPALEDLSIKTLAFIQAPITRHNDELPSTEKDPDARRFEGR